jgi:hypothetical protein
MKNSILIVILLLFSFGCKQEPTEADKASAESTIKEFYSSMEKLDFDQLKTFCTPDFSGFEDGLVSNSIDEFIAMVKSFGFTTIQIKMDFVKTDISGNMAHSIVKFDGQFSNAKAEMNLKTFENYILKKIDGKWLISFYHSSRLNAPQRLDKGSLLGIHVFSNIELKPGVTMAQAEDFLLNKYVPAFNLLSDDIKAIPLKGLRGENKDKLAVIMYLTSDDVRNTLWEAEGKYTQKGQEIFKKLEPILQEEDKLFIIKKDQYTDWRVE